MDPTEQYIRTAALQRGMDPDVAVSVAKSEGLNSYVGDSGSSFGPFQLHYGGVASGGNSVSGLGDAFTKQTGLDARDPNTVPQQIDFALDHAKQNGWGAWHGWKGDEYAGIGSPNSNNNQAPMAQAMGQPPMPDQGNYLFGNNPTPVGLLGGLSRMIGIGSEPELGRRLQNAGAALMSVGNFGQPGGYGAAAMQEAANQPHYNVVSDAYGNRIAFDTRTGAPISVNGRPVGTGALPTPGAGSPAFNNQTATGQQEQQKQVSDYDGLTGPDALKQAQEESAKKLDQLNEAASSADSFIDQNKQLLGLSQGNDIIQGPGIKNMMKEKMADWTNGSFGGINLANQDAFDTGNNQLTGSRLKLMGISRIAQPEITFGAQGNASHENPAATNQQIYANNIQDAERIKAVRDIALKHYQNGGVLGPAYMAEVRQWQKDNPVHQNVTIKPGSSNENKPPLSSFWQQQQQ